MGFRSAFVKHEGGVTCHSEVFLHVVDRLLPQSPVSMLLVGVDNGGSKQIWESVLPKGSRVVAIDETADIDDVFVGRVSDRSWLESVLGSVKFDVIIDVTGSADGSVWPWLKVGGFFIIENYNDERIKNLMNAIVSDEYAWLPYEEILGVQYYPRVVMIEKRNPRAVPYLDIIVGKNDPVVSEDVYLRRGGKRVAVPKETSENL